MQLFFEARSLEAVLLILPLLMYTLHVSLTNCETLMVGLLVSPFFLTLELLQLETQPAPNDWHLIEEFIIILYNRNSRSSGIGARGTFFIHFIFLWSEEMKLQIDDIMLNSECYQQTKAN
jgi:hypothetical protein